MIRRAMAAAALLACTSAAQASLLAGPDETTRSRILQDIRVLQPALAPGDALAVERQARLATSVGELAAVRELARDLATGTTTVARPSGSEELWAAKASGAQLRARVGSLFSRGHWMNSPDGRKP